MLLKLNSYLDAPQDRRRDIADIAEHSETYHAEDEERYGVETVAGGAVTFEDAGAYLLGRDVARVGGDAVTRLAGEFQARGRAGHLVPDVMLERGVRPTDERIAALEALFMAFEMGLADGAAAE